VLNGPPLTQILPSVYQHLILKWCQRVFFIVELRT